MLNIGRNSRKNWSEEVGEFLEAENIEELADIAEVLDAEHTRGSPRRRFRRTNQKPKNAGGLKSASFWTSRNPRDALSGVNG